ncbi:hypothetical protein [Streptomyces jumonjinensis]|uniref:hypothetical protein n=1 Tax=Streptomyces jumonjinensis TaxID=1945 RepID=UPI0037AFF23A
MPSKPATRSLSPSAAARTICSTAFTPYILSRDIPSSFERQVWSAPPAEIPLIAARWGRTQEAHDEDEALVQQLRAGDFSGFASPEDDTLEAGR